MRAAPGQKLKKNQICQFSLFFSFCFLFLEVGFNFWPVHLMNFLGIQSGIAWAGNLILAVLTFMTGLILFRFYPRNAP